MQFQFKPYSRTFEPPWVLRGQSWRHREGLVLRVEDGDGRIGWGEVAPLPTFGTETLDAAKSALSAFVNSLDSKLLKGLPCARFGVSSALASQHPAFSGERTLEVAAFLPQGRAALEALPSLLNEGFRTFKWKIGPLDAEVRDVFVEMADSLPQGAKFRLDANGLLSEEEARAWLELCEGMPVEFLEQPLPVLEHMQTLANEGYTTPLALDESVTTFEQCRDAAEQGWLGLFVVKPSTLGDWGRFCAWHATVPGRCVYSTAMETAVGAMAALRLAALDPNGRAVGFGALNVMPRDGLGLERLGARISVSGEVDQAKMEAVWSAL